ncbi:MAG TPA: type I-E CRISPR-associated protein Cas5/CasD [Streptosporangiaceae bacterium]|jgi:CRISPR system Cascade subunit CasD
MSVLVLQLAGPLQAWGSAARFARRTTESAPTKSGVLGLLAAAFGRERTDDLSDLAVLRYGVRIDQPGVRIRDYQTAHHFETDVSMPVSERFYLADAVFVAAVEGDPDLLERAHHALWHPTFLPYLGRRSCPPSRPVSLGIRAELDIETALGVDGAKPGTEAWRASPWHRRSQDEPEVRLTALIEPRPADTRAGWRIESLHDQPLSFDPRHRRYALRGFVAGQATAPNPAARTGRPAHDPIAALGEA